MSEVRYIHWRPDTKKEDKMFANVHLLVGYNGGTITDFQGMASKLRETFPEAKDNEIRCGSVVRSVFHRGLSIIAWDGFIPKGKYPGWEQTKDGGEREYGW